MSSMGRCPGLALLLLAPALAGCHTNAWALEPLTPLIGRWEGAAETTFPDRPDVVKVRATTINGWARPDEVMVERTVTKVPGQPAWSSVTVWVRTEELGGWKTYMINTAGLEELGFAAWDEEAGAWQLEARSLNRGTGSETVGSGSIRFDLNDVREQDWTVRDAGGNQLFRVRGSYRRIRGEPPPAIELPELTTPRRKPPDS